MGKRPTQAAPPTGVLDRALYLLSFFSQDRPYLQLNEIASLSGLDKATALRALKIMVAWEYLIKRPDGAYTPGPAHLRMAAIFRQSSNFVQRLEGPIMTISARIGQTTSFFVRSGADRVCLARDNVHRDFRYYIEIGASVPLQDGGAAAQMLLAWTDPQNEAAHRTKERGYYISRGERNRHLASIAIPVSERDGQFLGVVTITGMAVDLDDATLIEFAGIVASEVARAGFDTPLS